MKAGQIEAVPGFAVYRFGANLYYANATRFTEEVIGLVEAADPPLRWLCLSADGIGDVDFSAAATLRQITSELQGRGVVLVLANVEDEVKKELDAYDLTKDIGAEHFFDRIEDALEAYEKLGSG
jgi:SulP family sulfate permease